MTASPTKSDSTTMNQKRAGMRLLVVWSVVIPGRQLMVLVGNAIEPRGEVGKLHGLQQAVKGSMHSGESVSTLFTSVLRG